MVLPLQQDTRGYEQRIAEKQTEMDASGINYAGLNAEQLVREELLGEFAGIQFSGINVSRWTSQKMRADKEAYDINPEKYTQSLGAANGLFAQQCVTSAKKERGNLDGVYVYVSGWQIAAMKAEESPQPDMSAHSKDAVVNTVEEIYQYLHQLDQVEKVAIFDKIDEARSRNASEEELAGLYAQIDNFETNIVPTIVDVDAGFGNPAAAKMLAERVLQAGGSAIQIENQVSQEKKCGHLGGKVTIPPSDTVAYLRAVRAAGVSVGNPEAVIVARTDSLAAKHTKTLPPKGHKYAADYNKHLAMEEYDSSKEYDEGATIIHHQGKLMVVEQETNGLYPFAPGTGKQRVIEDCVRFMDNGADLLWIETSTPDLNEMQSIVEEIRKTHPTASLTYNNSPSFPWTMNVRTKLLKEWAAEGKDVSAYPDVNDPALAIKLADEKFDDTPLGAATREYIENFQYNMATQSGVFHNLITLPDFHNTAHGAQKLSTLYFRTQERAQELGTTYGMGQYVGTIQDIEIKLGHSCVNHQSTSGTTVNAHNQLTAIGEGALTSEGHENTAHQFGALLSGVANDDQPAIAKGKEQQRG